MADQQLKDRNNRVIGTIRTQPDGRQELRNKNNRTLGTYYPKSNETRDHSNRIIGKGNLLATLL